jgi:hypothetical protein
MALTPCSAVLIKGHEYWSFTLCMSYPLDFLIITLLSMIFLTFGHNREKLLPFLVSSSAIEVTGKHESGLWNQKHRLWQFPFTYCLKTNFNSNVQRLSLIVYKAYYFYMFSFMHPPSPYISLVTRLLLSGMGCHITWHIVTSIWKHWVRVYQTTSRRITIIIIVTIVWTSNQTVLLQFLFHVTLTNTLPKKFYILC